MGHYIISFTVYTLAMSGLIALALFVYKKVTTGISSGKNSKILSIEESLMINPRKTLMIVKAGDEKFLIASDVDKTSLIAKLCQNEKQNIISTSDKKNSENSILDLNRIKENIEKENMDVLFPTKTKENKSQTKKIVHLDLIDDKTPQMPLRRKSQNNKRKSVTIEVGKVENKGFSTIKELAHKINEI